MKLFKKKNISVQPVTDIASAQREFGGKINLPPSVEPFEMEIYDRLRYAVPVLDALFRK